MPVVRVAWIQGRTAGQKRQLADAIVGALVDIAGSRPSDVHVVFEDVPRENWIVGDLSKTSSDSAITNADSTNE